MPDVCPVLCYHAVADDPGDPAERLHAVRPDTLRAQLAWLARRFQVVRLAELARRDDWAGLAAVTFDDGYRSAVATGWPILRDAGLPATFFLIGEGLATGTFWRERVRTVIRHGLVEAFLAAAGGDPAAADVRPERFYKDSKTPGRDHARFDRLLAAFLADRGLDPRERNPLAGAAELPAEPGFAVGNHSARHYVAAGLSDADKRAEIADGQAALARRGLADGPFYAVPFGGADDVDARTLAAVREAGYAGALLSRSDLNGPVPARSADGLLLVERLMPADDPDDLARRIG